MPKALFIPPPLNTADIPEKGAEVIITSVREVINQWTTIGTTKRGIGLEVELNGKKYSQLFSLDKDEILGSAGRLLVSVGIEDTDEPNFKDKVQALVGKKVRVVLKGGKLYWYP